jgi:NADPH:quinone reductase-like Zn-dependent oxidoreductase
VSRTLKWTTRSALWIKSQVYGKFAGVGNQGTFAEYIKLNAKKDACVPKPASITFNDGAAIGVVSLTAYVGLVDHGKTKEGSNILVVGASGSLQF